MILHYSKVNFLLCIKLVVSRRMIAAVHNKHLNFTFQQHRCWQKYCLVKNGEGCWQPPLYGTLPMPLLQPFPPPSISDTFVYLLTLNHITRPFQYVPAARHDWKTKEHSTNFSLTSGQNTNMLCWQDVHMAAWPPTPTSIKMDAVIG